MRTSLLRQVAASRVALAATRPARLPFRPSSAALGVVAAAAVHRPVGSLFRFYSGESQSAESAPSAAHHAPPITRFADMAQLGVNDALINAITSGMRYENMTDVQSMTINPALAGKDVYVPITPLCLCGCVVPSRLTNIRPPQCCPSQDWHWQDPCFPSPHHPEDHRRGPRTRDATQRGPGSLCR
jgi:hypothetical protein